MGVTGGCKNVCIRHDGRAAHPEETRGGQDVLVRAVIGGVTLGPPVESDHPCVIVFVLIGSHEGNQ